MVTHPLGMRVIMEVVMMCTLDVRVLVGMIMRRVLPVGNATDHGLRSLDRSLRSTAQGPAHQKEEDQQHHE